MRVYLFRRISRNRGVLPGFIWTSVTIFFIFAMVNQPALVFEGAAQGLIIWWEIVFPSLLPFLITAELLLKLGFVHFLGVLLEPVMRPLFNVPGSGGFVLVMGLVGGAPVNGLLIRQLRENGLCTQAEAERLLCFTNFATPLFMITSVAVGMLGRPHLGVIIAGTHYLANIIIGLVLRFFHHDGKTAGNGTASLSIGKALIAMLRHQRQQQQTIGELLNDAITTSVLKLQNIGGFIILFAVIIRIFSHIGLIDLIASHLALVLVPLGFSPATMRAIASGIFETTIGSSLASAAAVTEVQKLIAIGFMLGWSGFSVQAQVASMVTGTDIGLRLFFIARIAHAFLTAALTWFLYAPSKYVIGFALPALAPTPPFSAYHPYGIILHLILTAVCLLVILGLIAITLQFFRGIIGQNRHN